jgi:hypothetical protein
MDQSKYLYYEFDKILSGPGCYIWYIDWTQIKQQDYQQDHTKRINLIEAIFDVYSPNSLYVEAKREGFGNNQEFGELYAGSLNIRTKDQQILIQDVTSDFELFCSFLKTVTEIVVPLYIGKSKNLNQRIKQHVDFLNDADNQKHSDLEIFDRELLKNFSQRFNRNLQINKHKGLRDHMLGVKVIYLPENYISEFEKNLNFIYKPFFGIR